MWAAAPVRLALAPVLLAQGLAVRARVRVLPEPPGPRSGVAGDGPPLRLLIAGDSSAAGVGCTHQVQALSGQLVAHLSATRRVTWRLEAASGATTAGALTRLAALPPEPFDAAVIALGVNDVTRMVRLDRWTAQAAALHDLLQTRFGVRCTVWSGVPPMQRFPALPAPLRHVLGALAARNDAALANLARRRPGLVHLPLDLPLTADLMAEDGFHPGPKATPLWAAGIAAHL
jgi:lysophospholipase L1-like esterase